MNVNPFSTTLKVSVNPTKNTVTLTPTMGTFARAFAPGLVTMAALLGWGAYLNWKDEKTNEATVYDLDDHLKDNPQD